MRLADAWEVARDLDDHANRDGNRALASALARRAPEAPQCPAEHPAGRCHRPPGHRGDHQVWLHGHRHDWIG